MMRQLLEAARRWRYRHELNRLLRTLCYPGTNWDARNVLWVDTVITGVDNALLLDLKHPSLNGVGGIRRVRTLSNIAVLPHVDLSCGRRTPTFDSPPTERTKMKKILLAIALGGYAALPAHAEQLRCDIDIRFFCDSKTGCKPIKPAVSNLIDTDRQTIARCDSMGCDVHNAVFELSGAYMNIVAVPANGLSAKLAVVDTVIPKLGIGSPLGEFSEVATQMTNVYVSFGRCK